MLRTFWYQTPLITLHNHSDQCAFEKPTLSSAQATCATRQQHDQSTYEIYACAKHAKSKSKRDEWSMMFWIKNRRAMNAVSRQAKNAVSEEKVETSNEHRLKRKMSKERHRYSDHTALYTTINQKQRFQTAVMGFDWIVWRDRSQLGYKQELCL